MSDRETVICEYHGDLFENAPGDSALVHCVSACLSMSKGIATEFKSRFGGVNELRSQNLKVGDVGVLNRYTPDASHFRYVFYMVTKSKYYERPLQTDFERALIELARVCDENDIDTLSMPRIGCGLDKLKWEWVRNTMERVFHNHRTVRTINVYAL